MKSHSFLFAAALLSCLAIGIAANIPTIARLSVGTNCTKHSDCDSGLFCKSISPFSDDCSANQSCFCLNQLNCTSHEDCKKPLKCLPASTLDSKLPDDKICIIPPQLGTSCQEQGQCNDPLRCKSSSLPHKKDCSSSDASCFCSDDFSCDNDANCQIPLTCVNGTSLNSVLPDEKFCFLNFEKCTNQSECDSATRCRAFHTPKKDCNSTDLACFCMNLSQCQKDTECPDSLKCVKGSSMNAELPDDKFCLASMADGDVCIGSHHLEGMKMNELVYGKHILANVLCDKKSSCATPGHMVRYNGEGMMMRSYCNIVGCERKVMKVNSPRYGMGKVVKSSSEGLEFTAFAARYATKVEEHVLAGFLRVGL